jgi:hypothetical protein
MDDDIIEIKPTLGPFALNIRALGRRLGIQGKSDPVVLVAERFLRLFLDHGHSYSADTQADSAIDA